MRFCPCPFSISSFLVGQNGLQCWSAADWWFSGKESTWAMQEYAWNSRSYSIRVQAVYKCSASSWKMERRAKLIQVPIHLYMYLVLFALYSGREKASVLIIYRKNARVLKEIVVWGGHCGLYFFSIHNYYFLYGLNKDDTGKVVCGPFPKESIIRLRMPATPFVPVIVWIIFCETLNKFRIWLGDKINLLKALFEDEFISLSDWSHCLFILVLLHFWQKQYSPNVCIFLMFFMLFIHHLENLIFWSFAFPSLQVQSSCYDPLLSP